MRKSLILACCCVAVVACQPKGTAPVNREQINKTTVPGDARNARLDEVIRPAPIFVDKSLLGTSIGADGNVAQEANSVDRGGKVYLTMFLHDSPVGLKTQAIWSDAAKKVIRRDEKDMKGAKVVTFELDTKELKPGRYHVEGLWGGNNAADKDFEVVKGKK